MNQWIVLWFLLTLLTSALAVAWASWIWQHVVVKSWYWQGLCRVCKGFKSRQLRLQHAQQARYALPACMDTLSMLLSAGYPISTALQQIVQQAGVVTLADDHKATQLNPLHQQLASVLAKVRRGESLGQALNGLKANLPGADIAVFVSLLIQASQYGGRLSELLTAQAELRRQQIAEEIEAQAQEAPVRLLFPLIIFIFPATILPFVGVILGKIMWPN